MMLETIVFLNSVQVTAFVTAYTQDLPVINVN